MRKRHDLPDCYLVFAQRKLDNAVVCIDGDEICDQLWAEIKIMRTMRVKDIK